MNTDIASLCATRPADRRTQLVNQALNEFDAAMAQAHRDYPFDTDGGPLTPLLVLPRIQQRSTAMMRAIARVDAQLHRAGVDNQHTWTPGGGR